MVVDLATNHCREGVETAVADEVVEEHFGGTFDDYYFGYNLEETEQGNLDVFFAPMELSWNQREMVMKRCWKLHCL